MPLLDLKNGQSFYLLALVDPNLNSTDFIFDASFEIIAMPHFEWLNTDDKVYLSISAIMLVILIPMAIYIQLRAKQVRFIFAKK